MMASLRGSFLIARRDLGSYFNTPWGYVVVGALLLIDGLLFNWQALGRGAELSTTVLERFFEYSSGVVMIAAVLLTIRLFSEERASGTMVLLEGAPIGEGALVFGKYLSALVFLAVMIGVSVYMPALIFVNGKVSLGHLFAGYLGLFALGSSCIAIGTFASALTKNQVVAGVLGGVMVVFLLLMWVASRATSPPFTRVFDYLSLWDRHFRPFMTGQIQSESLVYYGTLTVLFLAITTRTLAWRRGQ